jgi:hypothetical protein
MRYCSRGLCVGPISKTAKVVHLSFFFFMVVPYTNKNLLTQDNDYILQRNKIEQELNFLYI